MAITSLPPGFRFHPTDVELIKYYLKRKVLGKKLDGNVIAEVDIYKNEPWDLPDKSYLPSRDLKWYFYCPREKKYASGGRLNRATEKGYWKTTGKDRPVLHNTVTVGMIKTLVYHLGRAPKGDRTDWVMHEYRLDEKDLADKGVVQDVFVLCMIFRKEGLGPRNGAQYGAPFIEDDWSDDEFDGPRKAHSEVITVPVSESICTVSTSDPGRPEILPCAEKLVPIAESGVCSTLDLSQIQEDGDLFSLADLLQDDYGPGSADSNENELKIFDQTKDREDIFEGLGDLQSWFGLCGNETSLEQVLEATTADDPAAYIQLTDLETPLD